VLGAVSEEVVDDHADDGEEEDDEAPDDLVERRAVRLDNLDCVLVSEADPARKGANEVFEDVPHAMISRTSTMKPMIPPPVGPCQPADWVVRGAASTNRASESCRRAARASWNMAAVYK
jgi:hypothetical protein